MSLLDGRHRWGPVEGTGTRRSRTCLACGRTDSYEVLIPDAVVEALVRVMRTPNPHRSLARLT